MVEIGSEGQAAQAHGGLGYPPPADAVLTTTYFVAIGEQTIMIEKEYDNLTKQEIVQCAVAVVEAQAKELRTFCSLRCFKRYLRKHAKTCVDTRWVLRWKWIDGVRAIRARLTVRGFKDVDQSLKTYAGTATRWG